MILRSPDRGVFRRHAGVWALLGALHLMSGMNGIRAAETQSGQLEAPNDLGRWGLYCYCDARQTPHRIVRADDNGRILWAARSGATLADIRAQGLSVIESQLLLLRTYGLLEQNGEQLKTTFAIVGPEVVIPLRQRIHNIARHFLPHITPQVTIITSRLTQSGCGGHAYAVTFGYALDGLLWEELGRRKTLPDTTLDLDHPLWQGAFWAMYPERSGAPGTNDLEYHGKTLLWVWTDHTLAPLQSLLQAERRGAKPVFENQLVITNTDGDPIHDAAQKVAIATAAELLDSVEGRALMDSIPKVSREQATLIVTHEFIWDLMDVLVSQKVIARPAAFDAAAPSASDLQQLIFVRAP